MINTTNRRNALVNLSLDGRFVFTEISLDEDEDFAFALLEKYLEMNYVHAGAVVLQHGMIANKIKITFATVEDALHFYLSH